MANPTYSNLYFHYIYIKNLVNQSDDIPDHILNSNNTLKDEVRDLNSRTSNIVKVNNLIHLYVYIIKN